MFGVSLQEKVDFVKGLAVMLRSGITLNEALASLAAETRSTTFRSVITRLREHVEKGNHLSSALEKEKRVFSTVFISLVKAGERSGNLQENLLFLGDWLERNNDLKKEIQSATLYPKLVLGAALILGGGLVIFILPKLIPLFSQLDIELPLTTRFLLFIAELMDKHWLSVIIGVIAFIIGFILIQRIPTIRRLFHIFYLRLPFFGNLLRDYQLALITQLFSTLLKSGLSMNESVEIISEAATNIEYQESLIAIQKDVERGTALSQNMKRFTRLYPRSFVIMLATGEKSGTLSDIFTYLTDFYSKEVSNKAKRLPTVIEPLLLILIAGIVGFIALSIISPIYELTGNIQK